MSGNLGSQNLFLVEKEKEVTVFLGEALAISFLDPIYRVHVYTLCHETPVSTCM